MVYISFIYIIYTLPSLHDQNPKKPDFIHFQNPTTNISELKIPIKFQDLDRWEFKTQFTKTYFGPESGIKLLRVMVKGP